MQPDPQPHQLHIRLLGPPQITWQGTAVNVSRRQARAALFRVAADPNPVSRDQLAFLFWPDAPDTSARRNLTRLLSFLRHALPDPDCLIADRDSVQLNPNRAWCDCHSLAGWRKGEDLAVLSAIAEQHRGPFLAGFDLPGAPEYENWQARTAAHIERRHLVLLHELSRRMAEQGNLPAAIDYASRYLAIDELAEDLHRHLIKLYALSKDRAAATRQFEQCSLILERELGVSPLPETRAAYEAALQGSTVAATVKTISPHWTILPSLDLPLVGRKADLQAVANAMDRLANGGLILISGEPGVGKSRLLQAAARASGRPVLTGNSHEATHAVSYQPLVEALRQALNEPALWHGIRPIWLAELSRLIPDIHDIFPDLPAPVDVAPEEAQARLFEAVTRCLTGLATANLPLLCLDDLHWADTATLNWLINLAGRHGGRPLSILATHRIGEVAALAVVKDAYRRTGRMAEIHLAGLSEKAIGAAIQGLDPPWTVEETGTLAEQLHQATNGNAFFVLETVRALLESRQAAHLPADLPLAASVGETIRYRLDQLSSVAQQLLQAAAVLSPDLEVTLLQRTAGRSDLELADALDEVVSRRLFRATKGAYQFSHDLVRTAVYVDLAPWRRQVLHRRAAETLTARLTGRHDRRVATVARHYDAAGAYPEAVQAYRQAAVAAQTVYAHEEAVMYLERAVALLPKTGADATGLHEALGLNLDRISRFPAARAAYRQAIAATDPDKPLDLARLHWRIAGTHLDQLYYERAEARLEKAMAALGQPSGQSESSWRQLWLDVQMSRQYLLFCLYKMDEVEALNREIESILAQGTTPAQKRRFVHSRAIASISKERYRPSATTLSLAETALELALQSRNLLTISSAQFGLGYYRLHAGDLAAAEAPLLEALAIAEQIGDRMQKARCLAFLSTLYRRRDDRSLTAEFAQRAGKEGRAAGSRHFQAHSLANLAWLAYHEGDWDTAERLAHEAARLFADTKVPFAWLALIILLTLHLEAGRLEQGIQAARVMLDPSQQRLPDALEEALQSAVEHWRGAKAEAASADIQRAIAAAVELGYL